MQKTISTPPIQQHDYSRLLIQHHLRGKNAKPYWQVNDFKKNQGWIIDISVIPFEFVSMMNEIMSVLKGFDIVFKIVYSLADHLDINNGVFGNELIGKAVSIYLHDEEDGFKIIPELIVLTNDFVGPSIKTDYRVGNNVYIRYGAFNGMIAKDDYGNLVTVIKDGYSQPFVDTCSFPPVLPPGIKNHFQNLIIETPRKAARPIFKNSYVVSRVLREHIRGNVYLCSYSKYHFIPAFYIIKEGNMGMLADRDGRDVRDRLLWQCRMTSEIQSIVKVPKVITEFSEKNKQIVVFQNIKSESLGDKVFDIIAHRIWWKIDKADKLRIIDWLMELVKIVTALHKAGYLHRDINANNFLVTRKNEMYVIDLELMYSLMDKLPKPAFGRGSIGFMSPQQDREDIPVATDDIYSLGACMACLMIGIEPTYLIGKNKEENFWKFLFLINDEEIAGLITRVVDIKPNERPAIDVLTSELVKYRDRIKHDFTRVLPRTTTDSGAVIQLLDKIMQSFCSPSFLEGKLWFSAAQNITRQNTFVQVSKSIQLGASTGISGALYNAARLRVVAPAEWKTRKFDEVIQANWQYLRERVVNNIETIPTGLHFGAPGIALALVELMEAGLQPENSYNKEVLEKCFFRPVKLLNVLYGIAGEGLALITAAPFMDADKVRQTLIGYADRFINEQRPSGAWWCRDASRKKDRVLFGFGNGMAGICYFLLEVGQRYSYPAATQSAVKGIQYITRRGKSKKGGLLWPEKMDAFYEELGWAYGNPGIALMYLRAYEIFGEKKYLETATNALQAIPRDLVMQDLSQHSGLAGIGEVYLEAFRITGDHCWLSEAEWLLELLMNLRFSDKDITWWKVNSEIPTADLMMGNGGVCHFINRFLHPGEFSFPLLPYPESTSQS